jgi:hypothetical protein
MKKEVVIHFNISENGCQPMQVFGEPINMIDIKSIIDILQQHLKDNAPIANQSDFIGEEV